MPLGKFYIKMHLKNRKATRQRDNHAMVIIGLLFGLVPSVLYVQQIARNICASFPTFHVEVSRGFCIVLKTYGIFSVIISGSIVQDQLVECIFHHHLNVFRGSDFLAIF
jgi:hypothetical protein